MTTETVPLFSRRVRYGESSTELVLVNAKDCERVRILTGRTPRDHVRIDESVPGGHARLVPREAPPGDAHGDLRIEKNLIAYRWAILDGAKAAK